MNEDWKSYQTYLRSRPDEAELAAIRILLQLCRRFHFHLHIVHLATALALDLLRQARAEGLPVTVETCPPLSAFRRGGDPRWEHPAQMCSTSAQP